MTTKRNKGLPSVDRSIPTSSNHRTEPKGSDETESVYTNPDNRLTKDDIASIFGGSHNNNDSEKSAPLERPNVELIRANSPTLKRLLAARAKLDRYVSSKLNHDSASQILADLPNETTHGSNHDKTKITGFRISSSALKRIKSQKTFTNSLPVDKVTYEPPTHNVNMKQKCSLEIWIPKVAADDDEDDNDSNHNNKDGIIDLTISTPPLPTTDFKKVEFKTDILQPVFVKTRQSDTAKTKTTTATSIIANPNVEFKTIDETSSKRSEPAVIPRVYHYEDYLTDPNEERPHSGKSSNTSKSDIKLPSKNLKFHRPRQQSRRLSSSTNLTDETIQSVASEKPMTSKNLLANIKQTSNGHEYKGALGSNNSFMINELMQKYSMIKRTHQELIQAKLQLGKSRIEAKHNAQTLKENTFGSPNTSDSASYASSDYLTLSVKKVINENSSPQSAIVNNTHNNSNKLIERRSASHKLANSDILPQRRLISIIKHFQNRQISANTTSILLPAVVGKRNDNTSHRLERSKTLNVMFDIPPDDPHKIIAHVPPRPETPDNFSDSSSMVPHKTSGVEPRSRHISKRSLPPASHTLRPEVQQQQKPQPTQPLIQLVQYQNIQSSTQRYHTTEHSLQTASAATNKPLVHLKYSNSGNVDRQCLVPD